MFGNTAVLSGPYCPIRKGFRYLGNFSVMVKLRDIEQVFFAVLQEDSDREEINRRIRAFKEKDWQELRDFSVKNRLFPQLYSRLLNLNLENTSLAFISKFKDLYVFNLKENIILERELVNIISVFRRSNMPVIPLKGPLLAIYIYGDLALRQASCDLDLLIPTEKINDTIKLLETMGYHFHRQIDIVYQRSTHQASLSRQDKELGKNITIDLHWNIVEQWNIVDNYFLNSSNEFWRSAKKTTIDGYSVLAFSTEYLLLYLVLIMMFRESPIEIRYIYDIHRLITRFNRKINWESLIICARTLNLNTVLFFTLKLSQDFFHTDLAQGVLDELRPKFLKENLGNLWLNKKNISRLSKKFALRFTAYYFVNPYLISKNISDWIRMVYKNIFKPMEEVMWCYNQPSSRISYSLYIKRLLKPFTQYFSQK